MKSIFSAVDWIFKHYTVEIVSQYFVLFPHNACARALNAFTFVQAYMAEAPMLTCLWWLLSVLLMKASVGKVRTKVLRKVGCTRSCSVDIKIEAMA